MVLVTMGRPASRSTKAPPGRIPQTKVRISLTAGPQAGLSPQPTFMRPPHSEAEAVLLPALDAAVSRSWSLAGAHLQCRAGCSACCEATFAISAQDVWRLRTGLEAAPPELARAIRERAAAVRREQGAEFPGNATTGELTDNAEWQEWFFERQRGRPCPVLNPESGSCDLYAARPAACRTYGHLIQIGETPPPPVCRLNFTGLSQAEQNKFLVRVADPLANHPLAEQLPPGQTTIAFALIDDSPYFSRPSI